jgi:hypothetical protein
MWWRRCGHRLRTIGLDGTLPLTFISLCRGEAGEVSTDAVAVRHDKLDAGPRRTRGASSESRNALEAICRAYSYPVYVFVACWGNGALASTVVALTGSGSSVISCGASVMNS